MNMTPLFLKYGAEMEVIAPQALRDEVASQLQLGAKQYSTQKVAK